MNQKHNFFRVAVLALALCFGSMAWSQNAAKKEMKLPQGVEKVTTVEGITEYDFRAYLVEFKRTHSLHGAVRPDRHEYRRINDAMIECKATASRGAIVGKQLKFHGD